MPKPELKVEKWIEDGHAGFESQGLDTEEEILEAVGRLLDHAYSHDIVGPILFLATNGKHYVGNVEFVITEADADYVQNAIDNKDADSGDAD